MVDRSKPPNRNDLFIDARAFEGFLVDMPPEWERRGLLRRRKGFDEVWQEIQDRQASMGERAGITGRDHQELCTAEEQFQQIAALLPNARKLLELLEENALRLDDRIQRMVKGVGATIEIRADAMDDRELVARYEKTCAYRSAAQVQGARTRKRNRAAVEAEAAAQADRDRSD